jgi:hypothetical protein
MSDQSRYINTGTMNVTATPAPVVANTGASGRRTWLHLMNTGAQAVYIVDEGASDNTNGYPIPVQNLTNGVLGEKVIEDHSGQVYLCCATGQTSTIKWFEQRD